MNEFGTMYMSTVGCGIVYGRLSGGSDVPPTSSTTTSSVTASSVNGNVLWGDANCDKTVNLADAILIMQAKANPNKYSLTEQGTLNADVDENGNGITNKDALRIQRFLLGLEQTLTPDK